jgi:MinD-like ATPase involved in chromosome partitioning or flagellar assembly
MMIALVSAKGSPGVTTTALAMTLAWPGRCLLAECDPAGGDILAGYLQGWLPAQRGLAQLAVAQLRGRLGEEFDNQLVDLDSPHRKRLLLPGVVDPAQSATAASVWPSIAEHLYQRSRSGWNVLVDCGRPTTGHFGWPLLRRADRVLVVVRGTLPSLSATVPVLRSLRQPPSGEGVRPGLVIVEIGPYRAGEVARRLGTEVMAVLPADHRTASRLSFGGPVHRRAALLRTAASARATLAAGVPEPAAQAGPGSGPSASPEVAHAV